MYTHTHIYRRGWVHLCIYRRSVADCGVATAVLRPRCEFIDCVARRRVSLSIFRRLSGGPEKQQQRHNGATGRYAFGYIGRKSHRNRDWSFFFSFFFWEGEYVVSDKKPKTKYDIATRLTTCTFSVYQKTCSQASPANVCVLGSVRNQYFLVVSVTPYTHPNVSLARSNTYIAKHRRNTREANGRSCPGRFAEGAKISFCLHRNKKVSNFGRRGLKFSTNLHIYILSFSHNELSLAP